MGKELMLGFGAVICFSMYFFCYTFNRLLSVYKDAAGLWHEDRFRPLVSALANLVLSLVLVRFWGINGILLGTVLPMVLIEMPWVIHNLFHVFFEPKMLRGYLTQVLRQVGVMVLACAVVCLLCFQIHGNAWISLMICAGISFLVPNVLFWMFLRKAEMFGDSVRFLDKLTKKKLRLEKLLFRKKAKKIDAQKNS